MFLSLHMSCVQLIDLIAFDSVPLTKHYFVKFLEFLSVETKGSSGRCCIDHQTLLSIQSRYDET